MAAQRNAPCPCGSGRKYKHCCGRTAVQDFPAPVRLVKAQLDPARNALLRFASREYGIDAIAEAWEEFCPYDFDQDDYDDDALLAEAFDGPDGGLFAAWFLTLWPAEPGETPFPDAWPTERTIAAQFLAHGTPRATPPVRRLIEAWRHAPLCFWEVTEVEPGLGVRLRDHCLGREHMVYDRSVSQIVSRWDNLFAQIIEVDGVHVFGAVGSRLVPAALTPQMREFGAALRANAASDAPEDLIDYDLDMLGLYHEVVEETGRTTTPVLQNTDGEALIPTRSTFALDNPDLAELRAALLALPDIEVDDEDDREPTRFVWLVDSPGKDIPNTLMGSLSLEGGKLETECNSRERDAALRRKLESALGPWLRHEDTVAEPLDLESAMGGGYSPHGSRGSDSPAAYEPPEFAVLERQFMGDLIRKWASEPIPALDGRTPKQVVRSAAGRQKVIDLINGWENMIDRTGKGFGAEFNALRRSLGLPEA